MNGAAGVAKAGQSYFHRGGDEPLLGLTIPGHFGNIARRLPDRQAVVSLPQRRRLSYREFSAGVDALARGLLGLGFERGERIAIWSTNNIEWLLLQMATARIGAILVNIKPAYRPRELAYAPRAADETSRPCPGFTTWQEVIAAGADVSSERLDEVTASLDRDDEMNIQYTSGTTGFPKAVVLTHHNILNNAYFAARAMHFTERDRLCIAVPFYHCFGMVLANLLCLSVGACAVIPAEHFEPGAVLETVHEERCTAIHGVPTMFIAELEHPQFERFDLTSLRTGIMAGAPCPPALMSRVIEAQHCPEILIGYGQARRVVRQLAAARANGKAESIDRIGGQQRAEFSIGMREPGQFPRQPEIRGRFQRGLGARQRFAGVVSGDLGHAGLGATRQ